MPKKRKRVNKFNFKNLEQYQIRNLIAILICLFFVGSLSVGYAVLSQSLKVDGSISLRTKKDIRITNIGSFQSTNHGYDDYNPTYNENSITTHINLPELTSMVTYTVTIVNNSTLPMEVVNIETPIYNNNDMIYDLVGIKKQDIISANTTVTFTVTFKYAPELVALPENTKLGSNIKFSFIEHKEQTSEYSKEGLLLNLQGITAPENNKWIDQAQKKQMTLSNVTYDETKKAYYFSGDAFATLNEAIIPETGDFTLEVIFTAPEDLSVNQDQAVVAQISDTANDSGRFKINAKYENNQNKVLLFYNDTGASTNRFLYFNHSITSKQAYSFQVVRTGEQYKLYQDTIDTKGGMSYAGTAKISQGPFKLGKWHNNEKQSYHGYIYAVRVYNRALTLKELQNNNALDNEYYNLTTEEKPTTLRQHALKYQISDVGGDLYKDNIGNYTYRGANPNNYLKIGDSTDLYRIIYYHSDGSMKVINTTYRYTGAYDSSGNRTASSSIYCDVAGTTSNEGDIYGCNAWYNSDSYTNAGITGNVQNDATLNTYFNETYYNSLSPSVKSKIIKHDFAIGSGVTGSNRDSQNSNSITTLWKGNIGLPTLADLMNASNTNVTVGTGQTYISNYLITIAKPKEIYWTMTVSADNTYDVFAATLGSTFGRRRVNRITQDAGGGVLYNFYASPSFYIDSDVEYTGTGSPNNPFQIP